MAIWIWLYIIIGFIGFVIGYIWDRKGKQVESTRKGKDE
jgi:uncharacterized membrane protein YpjA